jgi:hypothetical protein
MNRIDLSTSDKLMRWHLPKDPNSLPFNFAKKLLETTTNIFGKLINCNLDYDTCCKDRAADCDNDRQVLSYFNDPCFLEDYKKNLCYPETSKVLLVKN